MLASLLYSCVLSVAGLEGGPMLGDLTETGVRIWFRPHAADPVTVDVWAADGVRVSSADVKPDPQADGSVTAVIDGLQPGTRYHYVIDGEHDPGWFFTTPEVDKPRARIALGSCAKEAEGSGRVWSRIDSLRPDALVLLGDTPYIDSTDLTVQRQRYRAFAAFPPFAALAAHTPVYSTWDDHDIGVNDTDGRLPGKNNSRRAFIEHRPNPSFGSGDAGIYTSFQTGPVEVFVLDSRWFARTEGVEGDWSLLGAGQWDWLERSIRSSTAPCKVIACSMVFNASVRTGKHDCWGAYPQEYERLRALVDDIEGVILVSGDVHWSRVLEHRASDTWPLMEFVTSPVHEHLIPAANPPHPWLRWSRGEANSFLLLDADRDRVRVSFMNAHGQVLHNQIFRFPQRSHRPHW